jgi:thiamine-monophosphate kinase
MAAVPLSEPARAALGLTGIETIVSGGDDYEVLCAIPENRWTAFLEAAQRAGVPVTAIGRITAGEGPPRFRDAQGRVIALKRLSYSHF